MGLQEHSQGIVLNWYVVNNKFLERLEMRINSNFLSYSRRGLLVDITSCLKTTFRGWKSSSGWRFDSSFCSYWKIFGKHEKNFCLAIDSSHNFPIAFFFFIHSILPKKMNNRLSMLHFTSLIGQYSLMVQESVAWSMLVSIFNNFQIFNANLNLKRLVN